MPKGFDNIRSGMLRLDRETRQAAHAGMQVGADELTGALQATDAHGDQTGATRASYVAYATSSVADGSGAQAAGASEAASLNPGRSESSSVGGPPADVIRVVATSGTEYQIILENRNGGEKATIRPLASQYAPRVAGAAFDAIKRVF